MLWLFSLMLFFIQCGKDDLVITPTDGHDPPAGFIFGADLSYVNQVIDHNGLYLEDGVVKNPYQIFKDNGTNLVRLRLWHNPQWTKEIYGTTGTQLYNDLADVERAITEVKKQGMATLLDFHYSDNWADPGKQEIPEAWLGITEISVLEDSMYNYTFKVLSELDSKGLMPEYVQLGNETNCGMLYSNAPAGFPDCNGCQGNWPNLRRLFNSAIKAVRDASAGKTVQPKIILHVADPKNVEWWFAQLTSGGVVTDFDIIGFSYYPIWHTTVKPLELSDKIALFKNKFGKDVIILETAYPWTTSENDMYTNIFGPETQLSGYPFNPETQHNLIKLINQEVIDGGGLGTVYWEAAWITSELKTQWGTGSAWENNAFFDYNGNLNSAISYMKEKYN